MMRMVLAWNNWIYDFSDFDFHDIRDSLMKFLEFHDFHDSLLKSYDLHDVLYSLMTFKNIS